MCRGKTELTKEEKTVIKKVKSELANEYKEARINEKIAKFIKQFHRLRPNKYNSLYFLINNINFYIFILIKYQYINLFI